MSRYSIPVHDPATYVGFAGYDPPLQTFFATIALHDSLVKDDTDSIILWVGAGYRIHTVEELADAIKEYAVIHPDLQDQLRADQVAAPLPSSTQLEVIARFGTFKDLKG